MYQNKDQFVGEFLNESFEGIGEINDHLNSYSKYPWQREEVDSIYRKIHTLKGSSAYLGFQKLENFSTLGETILDLVKEDKIELDNSLVEVFVKYSAVCFKLLKSIEKTGKEIEDDMGLTGDMVTFLEKRTIDHSLPPSRTRPIEYIGKVTDRKKDTEKVSSSIPSPKPRPVIPFAPTIKVKASLLDSIMATVGELVLNRNYIVSYVEQIKNPRLALLANELSNIAGRLHSSILLARMRPLNFILNNINSMVQELAHLLGKKIDFQIRGSRTELDKDIIEMIDTSLSHLVRNAIVHGVEDEGIIKVTAYNEKEQVVIDVEDNGRGVNQDLVLAKAIEKGFVSEVSNKNYSDCEKLNLIFHPGLSTASKVTKISGRGMGLDIVRNNLEKVNGKIEVYSSPSRGTNFRLKIPLTSAIVSVLTFNSGGAIFCIYQQNIVIIEKLKKEMVKFIGQEKFYRLNNSLITLIDLNEVLSLNLLNCNGDSSVIVVEVKGEFFAIVVDKVIDTQEVVLRPIDMMFDQQDIYSGATVIDDGPLALVLNLPSFCKMACSEK